MIYLPKFPKPCLICNVLTTGDTYCETHKLAADERERIRQRGRKAGRTLYNTPQYRRARAHIKATATHCHICKQAFTNRGDISADHLIPGDPLSPLAPAHIICNSRRGNKPIT